MTQIWIVSQSSGSYEDFREYPVGAFPTKEEAQQWLDLHQPTFLAQRDQQTEEAKAFDVEYNKLSDLAHPEWDQAYKALADSWGDKAQNGPYEEWGYSLNHHPIPFYSHGPDTV